MHISAKPAISPIPCKAVQDDYIDAIAPRWWMWADGVVGRLPGFGSVWLWWDEEATSYLRKADAGWLQVATGRLRWEFAMPSTRDGDCIAIPHQLRPALHYPWCAVGIPLLLLALAPAVLRRAVLGDGDWRIRRPWLRLMWRLRPHSMARKLSDWKEAKRADAAAYLQIKAEWEAAEATREAKREAAFEAEVERRLAERLASAGA